MSQSEVLAGLREVCSAVGSIDPRDIVPEKTFAELGIDSLAKLDLIVAAEDRFDLLIADDEWARFNTVGDLADYIAQSVVGLE